MNICSNNHDEIVYESRECPLCKVISELNELEDIMNDIDEENTKLSDAYDSLSIDYLELKNQVQITNPELLV